MATIRDRIKDFRRVPAAALRANPKNWRTHPQSQKEALRGVLAEVGIADALIARETPEGELVLIDGHLRDELLFEHDVPVLVLDVTEAEADTLLATLDPLAALAGADRERLDALLREVQTGDEALATMLEQLAQQGGIIPGQDGSGTNDVEEIYQGMPEFSHEDLTGEQAVTLTIFFDDDAAIEDFSRRIDRDIRGRKFIWFPRKSVKWNPPAQIAEESAGEP